MTNKRSDARLRRTLCLSLGDKLPALTADVSPTGFCAELGAVFIPGSQVHGSIVLDARRIPFQGEVTWARPGAPAQGVRSRIGVRFTRIADGLDGVLAGPAAK